MLITCKFVMVDGPKKGGRIVNLVLIRRKDPTGLCDMGSYWA